MKTIKFFSILLLSVVLMTSVTACKGDDGADGQDGNANVQTYVYNNPAWDAAPNTSRMLIDMSSVLTNDIIENDVILGYVKNTNMSYVFPIPGDVWTGVVHRNYTMYINGSPSSYTTVPDFNIMIVSLELDGSYTPNSHLREMEWFKCIIIESTNTTTATGNGRSVSPKQAVKNELADAGVDINDYYAVCAYYGINPE